MVYFVALDASGDIVDLFEDANGNVPVDAVAISDVQGNLLRSGFAGYKHVAGEVIKTTAIAAKEKWERIKAHRDRLTNEGGYLAAGKWFHSDQTSRSQQLGLVLLGTNIPSGLQWKTMDGTFVTMTQTLAGQILAAAAASDTAIFAAAEVHRAAMEASQDPAAYDFSAGWPATFLG